MLSIYYVSIMMRIFYIDWQQYWECDRTMNIGANAHGKRTVSTKQPQVTDLTFVEVSPLIVGLPVTPERYWACFKSLDCFTVRPFFLLHMYLLIENSPGWLPGWRFFYLELVGSTQLQCIYYLRLVYWSLGRRGYFGVSNVALVLFCTSKWCATAWGYLYYIVLYFCHEFNLLRLCDAHIREWIIILSIHLCYVSHSQIAREDVHTYAMAAFTNMDE